MAAKLAQRIARVIPFAPMAAGGVYAFSPAGDGAHYSDLGSRPLRCSRRYDRPPSDRRR